jgi:hypothetical protein
VAKFSRKKTKIQKILNTGLLTSFETNCTILMLIPSSKKTNSFLPIPTSKTGGTLVATFQPAKKEGQFQQTKQNSFFPIARSKTFAPSLLISTSKQTWNQSVS